jgi:dihydroorotase
LELLLSLALKWGQEMGGENLLSEVLAKMTTNPARVAGLPGGSLTVGAVADVCIFDPQARWMVVGSTLASQGKHTPFLGYELRGQVRATIVSGHVAFERSDAR